MLFLWRLRTSSHFICFLCLVKIFIYLLVVSHSQTSSAISLCFQFILQTYFLVHVSLQIIYGTRKTSLQQNFIKRKSVLGGHCSVISNNLHLVPQKLHEVCDERTMREASNPFCVNKIKYPSTTQTSRMPSKGPRTALPPHGSQIY